MNFERIYDNVFELPLYKEIDYDFGLKASAEKYDFYNGGCSAICKVVNGQTLIGRNMDLTYSDKPAYIVRTAPEGLLRTIGVCYYHCFGDDVKKIEKYGEIDDEIYKYAPFLCTDVLNEKGFYIEINMRTTEFDENKKSKFGCSGTNPGAPIRICQTALVRYLADRASNVEEALKILNEIDIYSPAGKELDWNFSYLIADASGKHGIVEIAQNKVVFLEENIQTNFYLTKEFADIEDYKAGLGRYEYLKSRYDLIRDDQTMFDVMNAVSYQQIYLENPRFDERSELVGIKPEWTSNYLLSLDNKEEIDNYLASTREKFAKLNDAGKLKEACSYWFSIFTIVTNCNKKEMSVRFFEEKGKKVLLKFKYF